MARILEIAQLGDPALRRVAEPVGKIDETVRELVDDLFATSREANGAGIAAPQIRVSRRVFILSIRPTPRYPNAPDMAPVAVINPEILWTSNTTEKDWEGCLSIPGIRGRVPRPDAVRVRYRDLHGASVEREFAGFAARVFLHENDHLNGLTWLDRVEDNRDIVTEAEFFRLLSAEEADRAGKAP